MRDIQKKLSPLFYALLSLPSSAMGFALCVQISALSWILSTKYGLSIEEVGFVWAAGPLAGIFGQLLAGVASDNVWVFGGRRRIFIIIAGLLSAIMIFCLPYLDVISVFLGIEDILIVALIVALTLDLAINVGFNPARSIIADVTPEGEARTRGFTIMQTVSGFLGVLAYLISAMVGNLELIYIGVGLVLIFSIIPPFFIQEPRSLITDASKKSEFDKKTISTATKSANQKQLLSIYAAHAFTWLGVQSMFVFLYAYINDKIVIESDADLGSKIGIAFAVLNTVGFLLPAFVLTPLAKRFGRVRVHTVCIAIMSLSYFGVLFTGSTPASLYIIMAFLGVGWAAVVSLPFAIMSEYVDKDRMGLYMGIFNLSVVIPQLIVSGVFGPVFGAYEDKSIIFVICGISLGVSALLWAILVKEKA